MVFTRRGINIDHYPAVKKHLELYKTSLEPKPKGFKGEWPGRKEGSYKWYEIQDSIDYYSEFEKAKIIYQVFQVKPCFAYDINGNYCNNAIWIIPEGSKQLCAFLNSKIGWFLISSHCTAIQNGYQLIFDYFGKIPIPNNLNESKGIEELFDSIITIQKDDTKVDTTAIEEEIDNLLYSILELTDEEIALIENTGQ